MRSVYCKRRAQYTAKEELIYSKGRIHDCKKTGSIHSKDEYQYGIRKMLFAFLPLKRGRLGGDVAINTYRKMGKNTYFIQIKTLHLH